MKYTVVVRTIGMAGEKYQKLLDSIARQTIQPEEIVVVLPNGYDLPKERLGLETFVYSDKGMVAQRIYGGNIAKSEYILFLDDDLEFEDVFVEKMYAPIKKGICDVAIPAFLEMLPPKHGIRKIVPLLSLSACPTIFHRDDMYTKVLKSGGWSYNNYSGRNVKRYLKAETAAGTCFFCRKKDFTDIELEEELWLQDVRYPLWEDQVMFYKMHICSKRIVCVTDVQFAHLDAGKESDDRAILAAYANSRNKVIFWYKFIYKEQKTSMGRLCALFMYQYSVIVSMGIGVVRGILSKEKYEQEVAYRNGLRDGKNYIRQMKSGKL